MSLTDKAHQIISQKFNSINLGIDATCGNGFDTLFLARLCSESGKVLSFDIQEEALEIAKNKIDKTGFLENVEFIHDGHENMSEYIKDKADVVMFNLGYLPKSDKNISTKTVTTIIALDSAIILLSDRGLITIICYPGHKEGKEETNEIKKYIGGLDKKQFSTTEYLSESPDDTTLVLYILEKI